VPLRRIHTLRKTVCDLSRLVTPGQIVLRELRLILHERSKRAHKTRGSANRTFNEEIYKNARSNLDERF
jgi:hypothetical protein